MRKLPEAGEPNDQFSTKKDTSSKASTPKAEAKKDFKFSWNLLKNIVGVGFALTGIFLCVMVVLWVLSLMEANSKRLSQINNGDNIPSPEVQSTPQLAQTKFFDPNPIEVPEGYELLGPVPTDGAEAEYTMPDTGTVEVCFRGAHDFDKKGSYAQSIYLNDPENQVTLATIDNACKEYAKVEKGTVLRAGWTHPDQSMIQRGLDSGEQRESWPEPVLVYRPE